ncbi:MAG: alpha/beta hydrolase family protein [Pirellulales bacterium]|nr:alpha/beta hydrolase family protein [Pirellulales bacterium]
MCRFRHALLVVAFLLLAGPAAAASPPPRSGQVNFEPAPNEEIVPPHFHLDAHTFEFQQKFLDSVSKKVELSEVTFPSPVETPHPNNNTVHCEYFRPVSEGKHPGVVVLHILGGDFDLARLVARQLAYNNVAALFLKLPYYGPREQPGSGVQMISPDPHQTVKGMTQAVLDIRRAAAWLAAQPEIDPAQLGITGISLGGITSAVAAAGEPRFAKVGLMLAGGDFSRIAWESEETKALREGWEAQGKTIEELAEVIKPIDPVTFAANVRGRKILMLNARNDEVVPPACTEALWEALGKPEIVWWNAGHYTAARFVFEGLARLTRFFQPDAPGTPLAQ